MHISGDDSVDGQILRTPEGRISCQFPERMILVANHQLYTDWLFLWWTAYIAGYHGYLIIILKDAIKKIPIVGSGMQFFSWIFLSRRWETDKERLRQSIDALSDPVQKSPMWLLIFPEGTNLSKRSMSLSQKWAAETGLAPFELTLLPRSRGLQVCIEGLRGSVDWLYDCTIAYEDIPTGVDGQDVYNLYSLYIQGRQAPVTHIHWRRCAIERIPFDDPQAFDRWLYQWWAEKEQLLQHFKSSGRFPASGKYVQAEVKLDKAREALQGLTSLFAIAAAWWALALIYRNIAEATSFV
ncbi:acyltransferase-domain-containing protein [Teratosphaeria destructans]|uniref:Acyltransferase-domain-containing protein n=1 Tax=Teratosphaeria destructans TaxID=418781 RepID=A0A9W7W6W4_9PEZI|nr:acyltransferase-domain-containing protein [Teratosphaeria destructans]